MKWTKEKPKKSGWYWAKPEKQYQVEQPIIFHLLFLGGFEYVSYGGKDMGTLEDFILKFDNSNSVSFSDEPIQEPEDKE